MYVTDLVAMQTADPEVLALCESWDMHCRRRLRKPRRRHRHRWHRCKAVTEMHPLAYPKWVIPAIFTLYYIFILQISYTVNKIIWYIHIHIHIYIYFYSSSKMMFEMVWSFFLMKPFTFSIKWFVWHFKARPEKPHRKVSQIRPQKQAMGAPAAAGQRPGETVVFCNSKICKKSFFELQKSLLWRKSSVVTFSRSRMPTIWKSLLALQLYFDMPRMHRYMHRKKKNYMS